MSKNELQRSGEHRLSLIHIFSGVSVTILLYRLRRHNDRKKQEDREDEL